jgi:vacuolar-type H+-ATPase subunit F/Vma7
MLHLTLAQRLRAQARQLRTKPIPLVVLIPLLNDAADEIERLERELEALHEECKKTIP